MAKAKLKPLAQPKLLKLDLGCGKNAREGFEGVDVRDFGQSWQCDLSSAPWKLTRFAIRKGETVSYAIPGAEPVADNSVEEVHCSHFVEHLTGPERVVFFDELYRVMRKDAKATIIVPHWSSGRAYGDLTHQWPPVVEFFWYYVDKAWRESNAPHVGLTCDFHATWGYSVAPAWQARNQETQMFGLNHYREVAQDMITTLVCRK